MPKKRQLLNNPFLATLTGILLNCYGELVRRTSRIRIQADPEVDRLLHEANAPIIYAIWHCHVFFLPLVRIYARKPISVLLSSHRDAQIVGVAARMRGLELVEGSSTRGGTRAYRQLLALLRGGFGVHYPRWPQGSCLEVESRHCSTCSEIWLCCGSCGCGLHADAQDKNLGPDPSTPALWALRVGAGPSGLH